jgi:pyruvate formate lyase activating enzyme
MARIVECQLCPRHCRLAEGQRSNCRARMHLDGKLVSLVYGRPCSVNVDPIEKKPIFHMLPGHASFSLATAGCNGHCKYCQNWQISQSNPEDTSNYDLPPEAVVAAALKNRCLSIAYTYTEPIIYYEYMYDTSKIARTHGLRNVMVTAGYIEQQPLKDLCPWIDAAHVDLKAITDETYVNLTTMHLKPVQDTIVTLKKQGVWVEMINLVVPTWNDTDKDFRDMCRWIVDTVGVDTPMHFSRFWPMHQLTNLPPTPENRINRAWEIAKEEGIHFPYVGNIPNHPGNNTYCPNDNKVLIRREGYFILENNIVNGKCKFCGTAIPGIWT